MFGYVAANWELCLGIVGAAIGLFVAISKLTSTKKDDAIAEKAQQMFNLIIKK